MDVRARSHRALPVDAIVFDKDGTLFDFAATWEAWAHAFLLRATGQDEGRAQEVGRHIGFDFATSRFEPDSVAIASTVAEVAAALGDLRGRAREPEFLASVLDFLLMDDAWIMRFCEETGAACDAPMQARMALPGGARVEWT